MNGLLAYKNFTRYTIYWKILTSYTSYTPVYPQSEPWNKVDSKILHLILPDSNDSKHDSCDFNDFKHDSCPIPNDSNDFWQFPSFCSKIIRWFLPTAGWVPATLSPVLGQVTIVLIYLPVEQNILYLSELNDFPRDFYLIQYDYIYSQ